MTFNSIAFIFIFLPIVLALYYFMPAKGRNILLLIASLFFYAWGSAANLLILLFSVAINYFAAAEISAFQAENQYKKAKTALIITIVFNVAVLALYKYTGFLFENLNAVFHSNLQSPIQSLPIGISFYTFSALSYIIDIYRQDAEFDRNPLVFSVYLTLFSKISSGPIVRYKEMKDQVLHRTVTMTKIYGGLYQFMLGLFKKVLIADQLAVSFNAISAMDARSAGTAWLGMIFYGLQLYFDFSGYSDMAIGLSKMLGFEFSQNFNYPYLSESVSDFWRRWHISLGTWFREYIYIPLGGNRCSVRRQVINLLVVWLLTGLWHGASWTFVLWGLFHGGLSMLERFVLRDKLESIPRAVRIALTVLLVYIGWVFFFSPSLGSAFTYLGQMFGSAHIGFMDSTARYYLSGNLLLLLIAIVCCGPMLNKWWEFISVRKTKTISYVTIGVTVCLFIVCVANMVGATNSSFLYFQF